MIQSHTRELTNRERASIESGLSSAKGDTSPFRVLPELILSLACMVGCGYIAVTILSTMNPLIGALFAMPLGFGSILGFFSAIRAIENHVNNVAFARQFITRGMEALEDGRVGTRRVVATRVIELEAPEDATSGYLFDVGNGQILVFTGEHSIDVGEESPWPNSDFELARTTQGDLWLGIACHGTELLPLRVVKPSECGVEFLLEEREEVISADLEEYADSLCIPE